MIIRTVHTTLAKGKDDGKETGSRPSGVRRRRRGTGQGRKKQSALLVQVWQNGVPQGRKSRSHRTRHGVQTQRDPTTTSRYGAGREVTGGSLGVVLVNYEVAQSKQEPQNAARGPDPAISDDEVGVRGRDGRNRRLSWSWSGEWRREIRSLQPRTQPVQVGTAHLLPEVAAGEEGATDGYEGGHKGDEHGGNEDTELEELKEEM